MSLGGAGRVDWYSCCPLDKVLAYKNLLIKFAISGV